MHRTRNILALAISAAMATALFAGSAAATETTMYPSNAAIQGGGVNGVSGDHAPGFATGSFQANGSTATQIFMTPAELFGTETVTIGELNSLSFWTKGAAVTGTTPADWYINIYTAPVTGETPDGSWYGHRLTLEPYYSNNLDAPAGQWVEWSTSGDADGNNQLRVYDSFRGVGGTMQYGTYTDPFLSDLTAGIVNWSDYSSLYENASYDYRFDPIEYIVVGTGSGWASGFDGLLDGFTVGWTNDAGALDSSSVNFEAARAAVPEPGQDLWMFGGGLALLGMGVLLRRRAARRAGSPL